MWLKLIILSVLIQSGISAVTKPPTSTNGSFLSDAFRKRFPYKIEGVTLDGGPVLTIPYGEWDVVKVIQDGEQEKLRTLYYEIFDKLANRSIQEDGKVKSGVSIFDMSKYSAIQGFNPDANAFMVEMTNYFETHYDSRILKRWYLINTPTGFTMAYNLLKLFLPEKAQTKWKVYGIVRYYWQIALFQDVSPDQLTQQYGGVWDIPAESTDTSDVLDGDSENIDKETPDDE